MVYDLRPNCRQNTAEHHPIIENGASLGVVRDEGEEELGRGGNETGQEVHK